MNLSFLGNLVVMTLVSPAEAARRLMKLRPGREILWLAFFLAVVLNSIVQFGLDYFVWLSGPDVAQAPGPVLMNLVTSAGAMLLSVASFLFVGRLLGGRATFEDIMVLMIWLQFLQILALLATLVIAMTLPFLMVPMLLATALVSFYITLHFLNEAHQFASLGKAFGLIVLAALIAIPFVLLLTPSGPV